MTKCIFLLDNLHTLLEAQIKNTQKNHEKKNTQKKQEAIIKGREKKRSSRMTPGLLAKTS